jgi:hypothetical protein
MFLPDDREWPAPATNPENEAFFAAAAQGRLLYGSCGACSKAHYFPRRGCPHCYSTEVEWMDASGRGRIYSYTITGPASDRQVLAFIELEEGVRMITNIVDATPEQLTIGAPVQVAFARAGNVRVPVFTLSGTGVGQ